MEAMKSCSDLHAPLRMNCDHFGDLLHHFVINSFLNLLNSHGLLFVFYMKQQTRFFVLSFNDEVIAGWTM